MTNVPNDSREVEIGQRLAAHFATLSDSELLADSGLGLAQPRQYETQRATAHAWKPFSLRVINKQWVSYANVPLLVMAEVIRRDRHTPTIADVVRKVIDAGFTPKTAWPRGLGVELVGYIHSAKQRGLCEVQPPGFHAQHDAGRRQSLNLDGEEVVEGGSFPEGAVRRININAYERNSEARRACMSHYGVKCAVCGIVFGDVYGADAEGFIHVHHLIPLSDVGPAYEVNPVNDLRPVCPNCHGVIHLRTPLYSIEEVQRMLNGGRARKPLSR